MSRRRSISVAYLLFAALFGAAAVLVSAPSSARAEPVRCAQQYLYLHDMAGTAAEMSAFAHAVGTPARCSVIADYGRTPLTDAVLASGGARVAGFTSVDASAEQIAALMRDRRRPESRGWTVLTQGAGALVAQRVVQAKPTASERDAGAIRKIVAVGPIWRGTNVGFLGDTEDLSRRLGTYDAVLAVEAPLIDPWCAGCRELVRGSDLLVAMRRDGLPSAGVRYTNVISPFDGLVSDPLSAALDGMDNRILDPARTRGVAHHFALLSEPTVVAAVRDAVAR
ncbi:hypothetical protein L5G32_13295 [Gordonia sp. HY002]|uniref:hypothetical protein n=1 Tax=Gordonia zhenghanii TaxID=2911516 RepID=UPI001EEFAFCD|nr:hypothetical protein [Gordonia zhenghanii]MCF8571243.1 hypothetical protein [Gordonia zhenghanii]MCF8601767.1 hypothetical protein [Gordonia zhenghanii]